MQFETERLLARRPAMRAGGFWRDETLLDHLARAVARTPDRLAIVAKRSDTGQETRLTYREFDRLSGLVVDRKSVV